MSITFRNVNEKIKNICESDDQFDALDRKALASICSEIYTIECSIEDAAGATARRDKIKGRINQKCEDIMGQFE